MKLNARHQLLAQDRQASSTAMHGRVMDAQRDPSGGLARPSCPPPNRHPSPPPFSVSQRMAGCHTACTHLFSWSICQPHAGFSRSSSTCMKSRSRRKTANPRPSSLSWNTCSSASSGSSTVFLHCICAVQVGRGVRGTVPEFRRLTAVSAPNSPVARDDDISSSSSLASAFSCGLRVEKPPHAQYDRILTAVRLPRKGGVARLGREPDHARSMPPLTLVAPGGCIVCC